MDAIHLDDLSDYQEDKVTLKKFQRPYLAPSLAGFLAALAGFLLMISEIDAQNHPDKATATKLSNFWHDFVHLLHDRGAPSTIISYLPVIIFVSGLLIMGLTMFIMARATPVSQISGQRMEKYLNADTDFGTTEFVYVDHESKTYFRRVAATFNRGR